MARPFPRWVGYDSAMVTADPIPAASLGRVGSGWRPRVWRSGLIALFSVLLAAAPPRVEQARIAGTQNAVPDVPIQPIVIQRFANPGPLAGVVARVDLRDPRVEVRLVMAAEAQAGAGACAGRLEVPSVVARREDFAVAVNASYFRAAAKPVDGRKVPYYVGNCGTPVGWHVADGQVRTRSTEAHIQATLVLQAGGRLSMHPRLDQLPAETRIAVSGSALVLERGKVLAGQSDRVRHPRTAVGISEDGTSLLLLVVDGRQASSRGATLAELGELMKGFGAHSAINLDGGGSTAMVVKDPVTGVFTVVNRPSDLAAGLPDVRVERPVVDVLGVSVRDKGTAA